MSTCKDIQTYHDELATIISHYSEINYLVVTKTSCRHSETKLSCQVDLPKGKSHRGDLNYLAQSTSPKEVYFVITTELSCNVNFAKSSVSLWRHTFWEVELGMIIQIAI